MVCMFRDVLRSFADAHVAFLGSSSSTSTVLSDVLRTPVDEYPLLPYTNKLTSPPNPTFLRLFARTAKREPRPQDWEAAADEAVYDPFEKDSVIVHRLPPPPPTPPIASMFYDTEPEGGVDNTPPDGAQSAADMLSTLANLDLVRVRTASEITDATADKSRKRGLSSEAKKHRRCTSIIQLNGHFVPDYTSDISLRHSIDTTSSLVPDTRSSMGTIPETAQARDAHSITSLDSCAPLLVDASAIAIDGKANNVVGAERKGLLSAVAAFRRRTDKPIPEELEDQPSELATSSAEPCRPPSFLEDLDEIALEALEVSARLRHLRTADPASERGSVIVAPSRPPREPRMPSPRLPASLTPLPDMDEVGMEALVISARLGYLRRPHPASKRGSTYIRAPVSPHARPALHRKGLSDPTLTQHS
jgi:hypothetical protein